MNSDYKLIYHKSAVKFIAKLDKNSQERIITGLKGLLSIPPEVFILYDIVIIFLLIAIADSIHMRLPF
ncbi:mRNA-degrading endonuclease RelE of RelBE toxin-antitoxin system [Aquibacillus albus]|uniref:mRNA-degrading endonuclease RelE of RelBE toxin-antitoxin system n=1 Tax=Aquibacillus albus TaxID=1168171 RepID=A0ABS2N5L0_9BACI|nr:mRNA-degrading endonuclease RelE of RelBE toxin-antitoxin system [Aquibacillus albus]